MNEIEQSDEILLTLAAWLKDELQKELILQKHEATGTLLASIDVVLVQEARNYLILRGKSELYGEYVERGRPAGIKKVPVDALEQWAKTIGFALKQGQTYRNLAFAIQQTIYKQGIPTDRAQSLAPRRTQWVTEVLTTNERQIIEKIRQWAFNQISVKIANYVKKAEHLEIKILV